MEIVYTHHARNKIEKRKIYMTLVEETIKWPNYTRRVEQNKFIATRKLNGRSIEVVYIKEKNIKVITVYWI